MEFKGTKDKWVSVFTINKKRAVRNKGGLICVLTKPSKFPNQDERYDRELEETRCNQRLTSAAPELLEALQALTIHFKIALDEGIDFAKGVS